MEEMEFEAALKGFEMQRCRFPGFAGVQHFDANWHYVVYLSSYFQTAIIAYRILYKFFRICITAGYKIQPDLAHLIR
jgi:hypothetical protein